MCHCNVLPGSGWYEGARANAVYGGENHPVSAPNHCLLPLDKDAFLATMPNMEPASVLLFVRVGFVLTRNDPYVFAIIEQTLRMASLHDTISARATPIIRPKAKHDARLLRIAPPGTKVAKNPNEKAGN